MSGRIALVGSGEYLPSMAALESSLLEAGGSSRYVQIPTAAGLEGNDRISYWENLGREQAERVGASQIYLPIYSRQDAMRTDLAQKVEGAGLIYFSGGNPHHLAESLRDTPVLNAIRAAWRGGASLAGCSAGAMAMGPDIPHFRKMKAEGELGFDVLPHIRTIPHYNKFFGWIPDAAAQKFLRAPEGVSVIGIDEITAITSDDLLKWKVWGVGKAHLLNASNANSYSHDEEFVIPYQGTIS